MTDTPLKLNTGATIPALGLGTWQSPEGQVKKAVAHAIKTRYRHIDCAYCYANEAEVGEGIQQGIKEAGISRSDLFITTKLWCTYHTRVEENLDKSLKDLGLDYVDLYLMHWPVAMNPNGNHDRFPKHPDGSRDLVLERKHVDTYKDMEKLLAGGKVKAIGVCNYSKQYLEELLPQISVVPAVNQIENHPLLPQQEIVDLCKEKGILITAYSPLGSTGSPLMQDDHVVKLAKDKGVSPGCILLSYHGKSTSSFISKHATFPCRTDANTADLHSRTRQRRAGQIRDTFPDRREQEHRPTV
jgi:glycerol 2-dehydrogenase (NADP+)